MPSFAIHTICGIELLKKLNISDNNKKEFIIGNLLPDVSMLNEIKDVEERKIITHFKCDEDIVLKYPNLEKFLNKYEDSVKKNIISFEYFFHLYTDYYYFKLFIPKIFTFLYKDMKYTNSKKDIYYVKINRDNNIYEYNVMFDKKGHDSIYCDYTVSNKYLINKHNIEIDYNDLLDYIDNNKILVEIDESNSNCCKEGIIKLRRYLEELDVVDDKLRYFTYEEFDSLVENIINNFIKDYGYLLDNYR